jgi:hypothetical protein
LELEARAMGQDKAIIREEIEKISGVARTWFEWSWWMTDTRVAL